MDKPGTLTLNTCAYLGSVCPTVVPGSSSRLKLPPRLVSHRTALSCKIVFGSSSYDMEFTCDHDNCGRSFPTPGALSYHKRSCRPSKKRLQDALSRARELWETKKKARITPVAAEVRCCSSPLATHSAPLSQPPSQDNHEGRCSSPCDESTRTIPQASVACMLCNTICSSFLI
jgi:hypothetical protein